jgi:acetate kinase
MTILTINAGSSSLKFAVFELRDGEPGERVAYGIVQEIARAGAAARIVRPGSVDRSISGPVADHDEAMRLVLDGLEESGVREGIVGVGHRIVHGGSRLTAPVVIDHAVLAVLEELRALAPLHNGPALDALRAARAGTGARVPHVATFDTAFHARMPERATRYAIDVGLADRHAIRRYGFHGLAHRSMLERYARHAGHDPAELRLITLQLGNGCSAAAVKDGHSVDTTMGLTPLEGLVMGTRSGDVDPALLGFLSRREGVSVDEVTRWLNHRAGLLGLSGRSSDMRDLLAAEASGDARARLAIEIFCYRVRKTIGAYLAALGGADAIVFGGGIGVNAPAVRARICDGMAWCGIRLDRERNAGLEVEGSISAADARPEVFVASIDEERAIARDALDCLRRQPEPAGSGGRPDPGGPAGASPGPVTPRLTLAPRRSHPRRGGLLGLWPSISDNAFIFGFPLRFLRYLFAAEKPC